MLTFDNIKAILKAMHFNSESTSSFVYTKHYPLAGCDIKVDLKNERFLYPKELETNRDTTLNFYQNENLVVFECVDVLLSQGYKPNQIILERAMPGGHSDTGGYSDIIVQDNDKHSYLLIECKTMTGAENDEFHKEWKNMLRNGGQLFNYYNSFRRSQYICLYASDFIDGQIKRIYHLIPMRDNKDYLSSNKNLHGYEYMKKEGGTRDDFFQVWKDTYGQDYSINGCFEQDIQPFCIGEKKTTLNDLDLANSEEYAKGKFNKFASILRKYNISSHENAFDKLVNLFLAKIVDEVRNPQNLQFLWKGAAFDDDFSFQDRLQKLYKIGMEEYLKEEITYVEEKQVNDAFYMHCGEPDAIKDAIMELFKQLKFYSNSDFGFLDVHNEQLFHQNAVVLRAMVQMLQDMRLKTDEQNQFLGDLFEGFLDQGVKQNEGQFFTPKPITRFMISSLPLEKLIRDHTDIPRAIDFACGAGHFLNEYASQIKPYIEKSKGKENLHSYFEQIYGIEKEYRLSKVSKVASFMYGQNGIQIIYGDALLNHENRGIKKSSFNVLVANPPYSVKGFLSNLSKEQRDFYSLSNEVGEKSISTNNSIETFFVERAKQLLSPGGIASIILPSSILSKSGIYIKTREIILQYFDIIAISEFGSVTFGKTGTSTVVLFLRRKRIEPDQVDVLKNRVNALFDGDKTQDVRFNDKCYLEQYCNQINISLEDYNTIIQRNPSEDLLDTEYMQTYINAFFDSSKGKAIMRKKITKKYTTDIQQDEYKKAELAYIIDREKEKFLYFRLASSNPVPVIVTKMPDSKRAAKLYLGYEWKDRRGSEGLHYIRQSMQDKDDEFQNNKGINFIQTPLFDPNDLMSKEKLNTLIRNNFLNEKIEVPQCLQRFVSINRLIDMIDFSNEKFDKAILTKEDDKFEIKSVYELAPLSKYCSTIETGSRPKGGVSNLLEGVLSIGGEHINNKSGHLNLKEPKYVPETFYNLAKKGKIKKGDILICKDGALTGKVALVRDELNNKCAMVNEHVFIIRCNSHLKQKFLFEFLLSTYGQKLLKSKVTGSSQGGINSTNLKNIKIPQPSDDILKVIVSKCDKVYEDYINSNMSIEDYKKNIIDIFRENNVIKD